MKKMNNKGFSLIELIIVIAIMAVLVAVIAPNLTGYIGKSKQNTDTSNADTMENIITNALQDFTTDSSMAFKTALAEGAEAVPADEAKAANDYLSNKTIKMNDFITECKKAGEDTALANIYKSLEKYVTSSGTGTGASAAINPKVTGNEFEIKFNGTYDEGFTCEVKSVKKSNSNNSNNG